MQARKTRDAILAEAQRRNELHRLVWVMMQFVPGDKEYGVGVGQSLIVLAATPTPEISGDYAHLMMEAMRDKFPRNRQFWLEVHDRETLLSRGITLHDFGETDFVCPGCAAIGNDCVCQPTVEIVDERPQSDDRARIEERAEPPARRHASRRRSKRERNLSHAWLSHR